VFYAIEVSGVDSDAGKAFRKIACEFGREQVSVEPEQEPCEDGIARRGFALAVQRHLV
jgi:hypothetical protein